MNLEQLGKLKYADSGTFQNVLEFVSQITNARVSPLAGSGGETILGITDLREDTIEASLTPAEALKNAVRADGVYYVVPQVVE